MILDMQGPRRPLLFMAGGHYARGCGEWIFHSIHQADFSCTAVANILTERFFSENMEQFYLEIPTLLGIVIGKDSISLLILPHTGVLSTFGTVFVCNQEIHTFGSSR